MYKLETSLLVQSKHLSELDIAEHEESEALPHAKHNFSLVESEENVEDTVQWLKGHREVYNELLTTQGSN